MASAVTTQDSSQSLADSMPVKNSTTVLAGGGGPLMAAASKPIQSFSQPILSHLLHAYRSLPQDKHFQDVEIPIADEASFLAYMSSPKSSALTLPKSHDLSFPLSSYYISSSHNTYLSGNQLYGDATTGAYVNVLRRGCRCLEIDVWDGDDSDMSSSGDEGENKEDGNKSGHDRADPKPSHWSRVKAKASHIRSRSHSSPNREHEAVHQKTIAQHQDQSDKNELPQRLETTHLSPTSSPAYNLRSEPRVLHGYTLTQSISFRSVCHAIKDSAFSATDLPIIVSLEVHASLSQQEIMVQIMRETWAGHLVDISQMSEPEISVLPSPESLRNKILIKVKWSPNTETGESNNPLDHIATNTTDGLSESGVSSTPNKQKKASKILLALSELGVYTRAYSFKHFSQPEASIPTHVFSLSEGKMHEMHGDPSHGPALFDHNRNFLMRVFPKGTRIRSTNVDPTFHWRQGAQMVALNWQKLDKGMMLNEGMFAGQEGWVLKPEGFRGTRPLSNQSADKETNPPNSSVQKHVLNLEVTLLAAQDLTVPSDRDVSHLSKLKPYVRAQLHVDIHGPPGQGKISALAKNESDAYGEDDAEANKLKRQSKTSRSGCPDFGGEKMSWLNVPDVVDELSFLRLQIKDDHAIGKDEVIAWACIRLDRLLSGYRFVHLLDEKGMPSSAVLLIEISKILA